MRTFLGVLLTKSLMPSAGPKSLASTNLVVRKGIKQQGGHVGDFKLFFACTRYLWEVLPLSKSIFSTECV